MKSIKKWLNKSKFMAAALALTATLGVGMTVAYFTDIETAINKVLIGNVDISTDEAVTGIIKENIGITAAGTAESYIRVRVDIPELTYTYTVTEGGTEKSLEGQALITTFDNPSVELTAVQWNTGNGPLTAAVTRYNEEDNTTSEETAFWYKLDDGFWYLSTTLDEGDKAQIIKSLTYPGLWDSTTDAMVDPLPMGVTLDMLSIPITSEAVQVENLNVESAGAGESDAARKACLQAQEAFRIVNESNQ